MENQNSIILISKNSAYDYINEIVYKKLSSIITREHYGINQSCKYRPLQDYYYLVELLTSLKLKVDCLLEKCASHDEIKKLIDNYACASKCLACFNLPTSYLYELFGLKFENFKGDYLLSYTVVIIKEGVIESKTQTIGISDYYSLNVVNPDPNLYEYIYFILDGEYITPPPTIYDFGKINCNHNIIVGFRDLGCQESIPEDILISLTNATQTSFTVSWNNVASNYLVELYKGSLLINTINTTNNSASFTSLSPSSEYRVRITATNCAGSKTSFIDVETEPYLVIVQVINGISSVSGTNVVSFGSNFTIDFDTLLSGYELSSFKINDVNIPISNLNITNTIFGKPKSGNYTITDIKSNKLVVIEYSSFNVCDFVNVSYSSNTITISV